GLERYAAEMRAADRQLVLCGDMNVTRTDRDVHPKERKPFVIGQRPEEREVFEGLLASGLVDVGRALDPDNDGLFTWWAPWRNMRQRNIGWRIDYILASESLAAKATACKVLPEVGTSDHAPVVATFDV
ncbi:MAG TPA: exodeoxyribonuclease III, partial [Thermoanaerobaculia bacterium]|nr:exodeoxyribonuclease III [Thermoanaerobaculia bacterium]